MRKICWVMKEQQTIPEISLMKAQETIDHCNWVLIVEKSNIFISYNQTLEVYISVLIQHLL